MNPPKLQSLYALWRLANEMEKFAMPTETPYNDMAAIKYYSEEDVRLWARQLTDKFQVVDLMIKDYNDMNLGHHSPKKIRESYEEIRRGLLSFAGDEKT